MSSMRLSLLLGACLISLVLSGCAAQREQLLPKSAAVPAGIDLSGEWRIVGRNALAGRRVVPDALVAVFLETGNVVKITQTEHGLFVSFDRAVVEEYRFGELREVNVGPVLAERASGWAGDHYVIETLDGDGVKLVETYRLEDDSRSLLRTIVILRRDKRLLDVRQVFERG